MVTRLMFGAVLGLFLLVNGAVAAEDMGVKIYPGATKDAQGTMIQNKVMEATKQGGVGSCYRTKDSVDKVMAFYEKEGFKVMQGLQKQADGGQFQKGEKLTMSIKFMKAIDQSDDVRICIAKSN